MSVLAATRETLYQVGTTDGVHVRAVTALSLSGVEGRSIGLHGAALGPVLAATYSPARGVLYVLDDQSTPRQGQRAYPSVVRLSAIDVDAGGVREMDRWAVPRALDTYALAEDPAGFLYLVESSTRFDDHLVVRVDPTTSPPMPVGQLSGRGALAVTQMRASGIGLSLAVGTGAEAHVVGYRPRDLRAPRSQRVGECY